MHKLQQFYILRIDSDRLKDAKFKIDNLTIEQARLNGELIQISNSQMVRTLFSVTGREFSQYKIDELLSEKKKVARNKGKTGKISLDNISKKVDEMLFIPEIINIQFEDRRHYSNILDKKGFWVNGKKYVPFMSSAGQIRRSSSLFIEESLKKSITDIFNNGRDMSQELVPAKFSAYYALYSSSSIPVTFPNLAVVKDKTIETVRNVDYSTFIDDKTDPLIEEKSVTLECNAFDGCGLITPAYARRVARDLGLDYVPSTLVIRAPFMKGMVVTFDVAKFAKEVAGTNKFQDIYGNEVNVNDVECIVTESMFKLWQGYQSTDAYIKNCLKNGLDFAVSKVSPETDKTHCRSSYQFLQVLDLDDESIVNMSKPTLEWIDSVSGGDLTHTLLYLLGDVEFGKGWFSRMDALNRAVVLENTLVDDDYFIATLNKSVLKKKNDAKIGRMMFEGNYSIMIPDPYYHACHIFGLDKEPLLKDGQHYSHFWNERSVSQVAGIRSPIVHSSEVNILNFQINAETNKWYSHIRSGIVFPAHGIGMDCAINGGSDFDGDLIATINSHEIINGKVNGLPIIYDTKKADKFVLDDEHENLVIDSQVKQIRTNKIGFYTNVSSSLYALLYNFGLKDREAIVIKDRLKYGRVLQGIAIDSAKGLVTDPFPEYWVKWKRIKDDMTSEEQDRIGFNNSIVADKRPYFMRWLYSHYNRRYVQEKEYYNSISVVKWDVPFDELLRMDNLNKAQSDLVAKYAKRSYFIDNSSTMNKIAHHVERELKKISKKKQEKVFDHSVLYSEGFVKPSRTNLEKMALLHKEYKSLRRSVMNKTAGDYLSIEQINVAINRKAYRTISQDATLLSDLAVYYSYEVSGRMSKGFVWKVFGNEIVDVLLSKKKDKVVRIPMRSETGSLRYLWSDYGMFLLNIDE